LQPGRRTTDVAGPGQRTLTQRPGEEGLGPPDVAGGQGQVGQWHDPLSGKAEAGAVLSQGRQIGAEPANERLAKVKSPWLQWGCGSTTAGNTERAEDFDVTNFELQWVRGSATAGNRRVHEAGGVARGASMGPRLGDRGKRASSTGRRSRRGR